MRIILIYFNASNYYNIFMNKKSREILSEYNISITNPRILVIEALLQDKKPISIDVLQKKLEDKVALSTLYRVLADLKKVNILKEFTSPDNLTVVELSLIHDDHHHHLFCTDCGKIVDIELSVNFEEILTAEIKLLQKTEKFHIEEHGLELLGQCYECKDKT